MILGTRKRFLFVHIPKCAGESITALLLNPLNGGTEWLRKHSPYRDAAQTLGHEMKTFAVLPWCAILSLRFFPSTSTCASRCG